MSDFLNPHLTRPAVRWTSGDALPAIEATGPAAPLLVDKDTGRLLVDTEANLTADLSLIESKQDTTNAILTTTAADVSTVKGYAQVTKGSGVVDANTQRVTLATDGPGVANLTTIASNTSPLSGVTQTTSSGKVGLDVNVISGGGGGGGASAAYNATLPTYTSGASTTLQTDVNGRLITTGGLTDTQLRASAVPVSASTLPLPIGAATSALQTSGNTSLANLDADVGNVADAVATSDTGSFSLISLTKRLLGKFAPLTDGSQKAQIVNGANTLAVDSLGALTANAVASQTFSYSASGAIAGTASIIGPIDCSQFKELAVQVIALGTGGTAVIPEISNDGTNWITAGITAPLAGGSVGSTTLGVGSFVSVGTCGARWARIRNSANAITAGTTTIIVQANQVPTTKVYSTVAVSGTAQTAPAAIGAVGFSTYHSLVSAATTNATSVKSSSGSIGTCVLTNNSASWAYFKLCNTSSAPTPGTTTAILNIGVAPGTTLDCSTSFAGLRLTTGIAYYVSGGTSLTDNTALGAAGTFLVNMTYS